MMRRILYPYRTVRVQVGEKLEIANIYGTSTSSDYEYEYCNQL